MYACTCHVIYTLGAENNNVLSTEYMYGIQICSETLKRKGDVVVMMLITMMEMNMIDFGCDGLRWVMVMPTPNEIRIVIMHHEYNEQDQNRDHAS